MEAAVFASFECLHLKSVGVQLLLFRAAWQRLLPALSLQSELAFTHLADEIYILVITIRCRSLSSRVHRQPFVLNWVVIHHSWKSFAPPYSRLHWLPSAFAFGFFMGKSCTDGNVRIFNGVRMRTVQAENELGWKWIVFRAGQFLDCKWGFRLPTSLFQTSSRHFGNFQHQCTARLSSILNGVFCSL